MHESTQCRNYLESPLLIMKPDEPLWVWYGRFSKALTRYVEACASDDAVLGANHHLARGPVTVREQLGFMQKCLTGEYLNRFLKKRHSVTTVADMYAELLKHDTLVHERNASNLRIARLSSSMEASDESLRLSASITGRPTQQLETQTHKRMKYWNP